MYRISEDDFALVHLKGSAKITNLVKTVLLPRISQKNDLFETQQSVVYGMGIENTQTSQISFYVNYADMVTTTVTYCKQIYGDQKLSLCAKAPNNGMPSACLGKKRIFRNRH